MIRVDQPTTSEFCRYSDTLLNNLYRWLSNPRSKTYCAPLQRHVVSLMNKMLLQLGAELRKLGARVVFADHHSLILCTGKSDLAAAIGYAARWLCRWCDLVL